MKRISFKNAQEMLGHILDIGDLYNIRTGTYVFRYSEDGKICSYIIWRDKAKKLAKETPKGSYWSELLGPGGNIIEAQDAITWCKDNINDGVWVRADKTFLEFTATGEMNRKELEEELTFCDEAVKDMIYRIIWKEHVKEDCLARMKEAFNIVENEDDIADAAAERYCFEGQYDCTYDYWTNIDAAIDCCIPKRKGEESMKFTRLEILNSIKEEYPVGCRVSLVKMDDPEAPPVGTLGTVEGVDVIGTIRVSWDNGSDLGVVYGEDVCRKVG